MNAINHTEAQAIHATAIAAPASPAGSRRPEQESEFLCRCRGWYRALRAATCARPRACRFPELAASIQRVGLLQNLIVTTATLADGERYEVVAEAVALAALKLLAKKHRISKGMGSALPAGGRWHRPHRQP